MFEPKPGSLPNEPRPPMPSGLSDEERFVTHLATAGELISSRQLRQAESEVMRALALAPSDLGALNLLALIRFKMGRFEEARAVYRTVVAHAPDDFVARLNLGLIAIKLDRFDEAISELEAAQRLDPNDNRPWGYLGFAYARKGQTAQAVAALRRAGQENLAVGLERAAAANGSASGWTLRTADGSNTPSGVSWQPVKSAASGLNQVPSTPSGITPSPGAPVSTPVAVSGPPSVASAPSAISAMTPAPGTRNGSPSAPALGFAGQSSAAPDTIMRPPTPVSVSPPGVGGTPVGQLGPVPAAAPRPVEIAPVPLVGFVLARLGVGQLPVELERNRGALLRLAFDGEAHVRADAAVACTGDNEWHPAQRRSRGRVEEAALGPAETPFFRVAGSGDLWLAAPNELLVAVTLEDDILYVREDRVLGFDGTIGWESGRVPGHDLGMLQFRGKGTVALCLGPAPAAIKLERNQQALVSSRHIIGWVGRVVTNASGTAPLDVRCEGEGVVLLESSCPVS